MASLSMPLLKQFGTSALLAVGIVWLIQAAVYGQSPQPGQPPLQPRLANAPPQSQRPGAVEVMLVKNALTAANHANITGNFTVLRDLGSASFRQKNSAGDLALIFKGLKDSRIDLSPVLVLDPQFTEPPTTDQAGFLKLVGYFPTQPLQVRFAIAYQRVEAGWVLDAISVGAMDSRGGAAPASAAMPHEQPPGAPQASRLPAPSAPPAQPVARAPSTTRR